MFAYQILAKAVVRLAVDQPKAALGVNAARDKQIGVGPQHQPAVALGAGEGDAFVRQPAAQPQAAPQMQRVTMMVVILVANAATANEIV